ncbi:MAG TPA: aminoacyl-tRNA hydrolase [Erysipelothrix sp.]|jgi:PTH1 family peptidyl-tRNA hydrolase|nr:aminoacyl-tRNA hydrolase [Erysipelothrix sp.]
MKCIVGLGNPGKQYQKTRHNTGFLVIDELCSFFGVSLTQKKFNAHFEKFKYQGEDILLIKPQTYMNLSGHAVASLMGYFKVGLDDLIVISDDLDLPIGKVRFRRGGNDGGQRGLKSIISQLGTKDFNRCRIGIGNDKLIPTADYVLGKVEKEKMDIYKTSLEHATKGVINWIKEDINNTMNKFNGDIQV